MPYNEPFEIPDSECERLTRPEMACCRSIMTLASDLHYAKDDLKKRLKTVPDGEQRMDAVCGEIDSLFRDILGTVSDRQRKQLRNQAKDLVMKAVPKLSAADNKVMIYIDEVKELVDCAREKCRICAKDGTECRSCRLYKWLETNIPLDDYGDDLICPYARRDWEESR